MPIESICRGCARRLRVSEEHAGKKARCPACGMIYTVPGGSEDAEVNLNRLADETGPSGLRENSPWKMQTPDGRIYGPVPKSELDQWVQEGRVSIECKLLREGTEVWQPADLFYPDLAPTAGVKHSDNPFAADSPFGSYVAAASSSRAVYRVPHRGAVILILGILSWAICAVFGPFAWSMGSADLRAMNAGTMDDSGRGLTLAGMILGIITTIILILFACFVALVCLGAFGGVIG